MVSCCSCKTPVWHALAETHCHVTWMNFLSRTVPPRLLESAAAIHDTLTRSTFTNLLGRGNLTDRLWLQATLPVRHGGFGLTALTSTAQFAFLSSWASTLHTIAKRIPDAERLLENSHHSNSFISRDLCNVLPQNKSLVEVINDRKQLQHKLTEEYMKSLSNGFIQNSSSTRDQSRMKSLQGKGAGAWLLTVPSSSWHTLSPCDFRLASLMRLGCQMPLASG